MSLYIHWPYCARICPYCDFNVYKSRHDEVLVPAIIQDLTGWSTWVGARNIISVHFGGGTPSLMQPSDMRLILDHIDTLWGLDTASELSLEVNPDDASADAVKLWADAQINRLSIGAQSFHPTALSFLGRNHTEHHVITALEAAKSEFDNISLDMIFGWHGETLNMWQRDLEMALSFDLAHISAYQLTVEPNTAFARATQRGNARSVSADDSADFYDLAETVLTQAGYEHYEVSNYAKPGFISRHNSSYWNFVDYAAIGPGAHGRIHIGTQRIATENFARPNAYIRAISQTGLGIEMQTPLTRDESLQEYVLMGLRDKNGIDMGDLQHRFGRVQFPEDVLEDFLEHDLIEYKDLHLRATAQGWRLLDYITERLIGALE